MRAASRTASAAARPTRWRVAMLDPAGFTPPYDAALAGGLRRQGCRVLQIGPAALDGSQRGGSQVAWFYRGLATTRGPASASPVVRSLKGLHHVVDMARLPRACLDRFLPDVIHFQWLPLPLADRVFLASLRRRAPLVLTLHDSTPYNGALGGALGGVMTFGIDGLARAADAIVVHTARAKRCLLAKGVAPERVSVIAHGLLHAPAASPPVGSSAGRARLHLLQFGKLRPYKGVDVLLQALALLGPDERARLRVSIVGKPYLPTEPLARFVREAGLEDVVAFRFGFVAEEDIDRLFTDADAALFPYRQIDASGAAMTAVAHGVPVLASAIGGFAELFRDGREARLVPPGDAPALAAVLREWVAAPAALDRLRAGMIRRRAAIPDWSEIGARTLAVYAAARRRWLQTAQGRRLLGEPSAGAAHGPAGGSPERS